MDRSTGYAQVDDQRIAFQVLGDGPIDVVFSFGLWGSFDVEWEDPAHRLFYQHVASYARVIQFDQRGSGASDPISLDALPPWESFVNEMEAVLDAVGSSQPVIFAGGAASPVALLFAATHPERVRALVLWLAGARYLRSDDYPIGWTDQQFDEVYSRFQDNWGSGETFDHLYPSRAGDERLRAWYSKFERSISSPRTIQQHQRTLRQTDARALLPAITVPTLVLHPVENAFVPLAWGKYIADHIEGARLVELPGRDVAPYWEQPELTLDAIESFLTVTQKHTAADRKLATVLFTDIAGSTEKADKLGDRRWSAVLDLHDELTADLVDEHGGTMIKSTGDGVLATFDGPGRAIRSASAMQQELAKADLQIRVGIHVGEIEIRSGDVGGIAVHLAARIMAAAGPGEILVSNTVKDLVIGSDIAFEDLGTHILKGFDGEWQLHQVVQPDSYA